MNLKVDTLLFVMVGLIIMSSCNKSKETPTCDGTAATYNSTIKSIIDANCTSSGCHPTYTAYTAIKPILDNGQFKSEVITNQRMPKGTKTLSKDELNKIQCWVDSGYPEK